MSQWTLNEIHDFWKTHDSADYWEDTEGADIQVKKREQRAVSVRLPVEDIVELKKIAQHKGMGHTTLIRVWIKEKLREARRESS
jgi:predicted DNA binding CopG/RHH family protein